MKIGRDGELRRLTFSVASRKFRFNLQLQQEADVCGRQDLPGGRLAPHLLRLNVGSDMQLRKYALPLLLAVLVVVVIFGGFRRERELQTSSLNDASSQQAATLLGDAHYPMR